MIFRSSNWQFINGIKIWYLKEDAFALRREVVDILTEFKRVVNQTKANESMHVENSTQDMDTQNELLKKMKSSTLKSDHAKNKIELIRGEITNNWDVESIKHSTNKSNNSTSVNLSSHFCQFIVEDDLIKDSIDIDSKSSSQSSTSESSSISRDMIKCQKKNLLQI